MKGAIEERQAKIDKIARRKKLASDLVDGGGTAPDGVELAR